MRHEAIIHLRAQMRFEAPKKSLFQPKFIFRRSPGRPATPETNVVNRAPPNRDRKPSEVMTGAAGGGMGSRYRISRTKAG